MHSLVTLQGAVIGLLIATLLAAVIVVSMDLPQSFKYNISSHLVVTRTVPVVMLGPLFPTWLGFDMVPKILIVIFICFSPVAIALCDVLGKVDGHQTNLLKGFGTRKWQIYTHVKILTASTALFSGLKIAATCCIDGTIIGEWLSAPTGFGYYMTHVKNGYMLGRVFAYVVAIITLSLLLHGAVTLLRAVLSPCARKRRGKAK